MREEDLPAPSRHILAPWDDETVATLQMWQDGPFHPFTCPHRDTPQHRSMEGALVATRNGWICPFCDYRQLWAHAFMADRPSIERATAELHALRQKLPVHGTKGSEILPTLNAQREQ